MAGRELNDRNIAEILEFEDNISEIDGFLDDLDDSPDFLPDPQEPDDSSTESEEEASEVEPPPESAFPTSSRRVYWKHQDMFAPDSPGLFCQPLAATRVRVVQSPIEYFARYIPDIIYEKMCMCTNQTYLLRTGVNLNATKDEIKMFFGISLAMSYLGLPRIRMFWADKTRVPMIADRMTRDRFLKLRTNLKLVNDLEVDEDSKKNKFWKVYPLIETVRRACLDTPRSQDVSIDEQMIPFWGQVSMRQFIRGKPNPCGLKNFVCTTPGGVPLDFFMYEGKGDTILPDCAAEGLDIGGKVVLKLSGSLPEGTKIYMDRYFTSIGLLDKLREKKIQATGTLRKSKMPKNANFKTDKQLRNAGRGSSDQLVRNDGQVACLKWFDNKPVILASTIDSKEPIGQCRRWCKKSKKYIEIDRPFAVEQYNQKMGGVDMLDRVISFYRMSSRSKKWTIRLIFHLFDFSAAAGWLIYRKECQLLELPKKDVMDYLDFKIAVSNSLLYFTPAIERMHLELYGSEIPSTSRKRSYAPQPPLQLRTAMAGHLPIIDERSDHICRLPGCQSKKARVKCSTCNIHLCLVAGRNCYKQYHETS